MKFNYLVYPPQTGRALDFDEEFDKISEKWAERARQLQKRRWLKIRQSELR